METQTKDGQNSDTQNIIAGGLYATSATQLGLAENWTDDKAKAFAFTPDEAARIVKMLNGLLPNSARAVNA